MINNQEVIKFYTTKGALPWATNFSRHAMIVDGRIWPTNEHYYQAMKFNGDALIEVSGKDILAIKERIEPFDILIPSNSMKYLMPIQEWIRIQPGPKASATQGRRRDLPMRNDWEEVKEAFMYKGLEAKFAQYPDIAKELLATGSAILIEDSKIDYYWGCGADNSGKNRLGVLLMKLREELSE